MKVYPSQSSVASGITVHLPGGQQTRATSLQPLPANMEVPLPPPPGPEPAAAVARPPVPAAEPTVGDARGVEVEVLEPDEILDPEPEQSEPDQPAEATATEGPSGMQVAAALAVGQDGITFAAALRVQSFVVDPPAPPTAPGLQLASLEPQGTELQIVTPASPDLHAIGRPAGLHPTGKPRPIGAPAVAPPSGTELHLRPGPAGPAVTWQLLEQQPEPQVLLSSRPEEPRRPLHLQVPAREFATTSHEPTVPPVDDDQEPTPAAVEPSTEPLLSLDQSTTPATIWPAETEALLAEPPAPDADHQPTTPPLRPGLRRFRKQIKHLPLGSLARRTTPRAGFFQDQSLKKTTICRRCQERVCCYHFNIEVTVRDIGPVARALAIAPEHFLAYYPVDSEERTFVLVSGGPRYRLVFEAHPWLARGEEGQLIVAPRGGSMSAASPVPAAEGSGPVAPEASPGPATGDALAPVDASAPGGAQPAATDGSPPPDDAAPSAPEPMRPCTFLLRLPGGEHRCGLGSLRPLICCHFPVLMQDGLLDFYEGPGCVRTWSMHEIVYDEELQLAQAHLAAQAEHQRFLDEWNRKVEEAGPDGYGFNYFCDALMGWYVTRIEQQGGRG